MEKKKVTIEKFVKDQIKKWEKLYPAKDKKEEVRIPVITVSKEPGAGGNILAQKIAERLDLDIFNRDIIKGIAESAKISASVIETLKKKGYRVLKILFHRSSTSIICILVCISSYLMKVVCTIAEHGRLL